MRKHFVKSEIINQAPLGSSTQYQVVLTDSEGNVNFLWMAAMDYVDWIEDPIALHGKTFSFDPTTYVMP